MEIFQCPACRAKQPSKLQCLQCGKDGPLPPVVATAAKDEVAVTTLSDIERRKRVKLPGPLISEVCGGELFLYGTIVVTGPAGAGKSTLNAHVALELRRKAWKVKVLDAEMEGDLCKEVFERAGATKDELATIERVGTRDWAAALAKVAPAPNMLVLVDSIDAFAQGSERRRKQILADCEELAKKCLVMLVAHWSKKGGLKGSTWTGHAVDCVVTVQPTRVWQEKCRWAPPAEVRRKRARRVRRAASPRSQRRAARPKG